MDRTIVNKTISDTRKATRLRRQNQICKVYELKVDFSKLNIIQKNCLKMMFIEAKWIWNYILNQEKINPSFDIFKAYYKDYPTITHYNNACSPANAYKIGGGGSHYAFNTAS